MQEIQPKNNQNCSIWKNYIVYPKLISLKFITEYLRWIIYLKFLVYLHGYAVFDKTWSSKLIFISSETEPANRTKPQYEPSDTLVPKMPNKNFCLHICIFHIYVVNFLGIITCSILKSILTILVSIVTSFTSHCVLKMLKSQWKGAEPKFIYHVKGGYIVISKS